MTPLLASHVSRMEKKGHKRCVLGRYRREAVDIECQEWAPELGVDIKELSRRKWWRVPAAFIRNLSSDGTALEHVRVSQELCPFSLIPKFSSNFKKNKTGHKAYKQIAVPCILVFTGKGTCAHAILQHAEHLCSESMIRKFKECGIAVSLCTEDLYVARDDGSDHLIVVPEDYGRIQHQNAFCFGNSTTATTQRRLTADGSTTAISPSASYDGVPAVSAPSQARRQSPRRNGTQGLLPFANAPSSHITSTKPTSESGDAVGWASSLHLVGEPDPFTDSS